MEEYLSVHASSFEPKNKDIFPKNSTLPLQLDLKVIEENEENLNINQGNISEEESLGYNSNYKIFQSNSINKDSQNVKDISFKRKASTVSTSLSQTDICSEANCFSPTNECNHFNFERKMTNPQTSHIFFGRERLNSTPITTYFEGIDFYLRNLQPEKNRYKKSNNYIEKNIFFKDFNINYKDYKYKSFDLAENKKFNSNQILKNLEENNNNIKENIKPEIPPVENNSLNNKNITIPLTTKYNNNIYGKFDMPMPCFGYYSFDCKHFIN